MPPRGFGVILTQISPSRHSFKRCCSRRPLIWKEFGFIFKAALNKEMVLPESGLFSVIPCSDKESRGDGAIKKRPPKEPLFYKPGSVCPLLLFASELDVKARFDRFLVKARIHCSAKVELYPVVHTDTRACADAKLAPIGGTCHAEARPAVFLNGYELLSHRHCDRFAQAVAYIHQAGDAAFNGGKAGFVVVDTGVCASGGVCGIGEFAEFGFKAVCADYHLGV